MRLTPLLLVGTILLAWTCDPTATEVKNAGATPGGQSGAGATHLAFTSQPGSTPVTQAMAPFTVAAQDDLGATDTSFTGQVTVAVGTNPSNGTLSGTTTVAAIATSNPSQN